MAADESGCLLLLLLSAAFLLIFLLSFLLLRLTSPKPPFPSLLHKHFFITGSSSGIGFSIAKHALLHGAYVSLVSRRLHSLQLAYHSLLSDTRCSPDCIRYEAADVTDYHALSSAITSASNWKPIDVLICNAGLTRGGYLDSLPIEDLDLIVRTNVMGTIHALHAALPAMKQRSLEKNPTSIVITASLASMYFLYGHTVYTATKFALRGLADALRFELLPYNINVCLVCPNFTQTPFLDDMGDKNQEIRQIRQEINLYNRDAAKHPDKVACEVMEAVKAGKSLVATGPSGFLLRTFGRGYMVSGERLGIVLLEAICFLPLRLLSIVMTIIYKASVVKLTKVASVAPPQSSEAAVAAQR